MLSRRSWPPGWGLRCGRDHRFTTAKVWRTDMSIGSMYDASASLLPGCADFKGTESVRRP